MKISIITPCLNQAPFLEHNINSILNQGNVNVEHIIIDGGSSDGSIEILKKYTHLKWVTEKDNGQADALNKALDLITGDIVGWVNSDDIVNRNVATTIISHFTRKKDSFVLVGNLDIIDENSKLLEVLKAEKISYDDLLNNGKNVLQASTFFRSDVIKMIGYFNTSYHYCMDHEYWLRVAKYYKFDTINKSLASFRKHQGTKTTSNQLGFIKETIKIKIKYKAKLLSKGNCMLLYLLLAEPFKRINLLRMAIRKLKKKNIDYIHYT